MRITSRTPGRLILLAVAAVVVAGLVVPGLGAKAAPSPASLTIGVNGAAPASQPFSGGPITGSADASGSAAPVVCATPACESIPLTVAAPGGFTGSIDLSVSITFNAPGTNPAGLTGLDIWVLDSGGNTVAAATSGSSPALAAGAVSPGSYTIDVTGEAGAVNETYTGTASAAVHVAGGGGGGNVPSVTQSATPVSFGPAGVVSPVILGAEPQISFERPVASPKSGAGLDPARSFVDWPVSSRSNIGTLWRSLNAGDSYRQVVDPTCAERQVPNCYTGGGGDTVNRVNNYDGTVNFGDQESLAQEAFASSIDHGDSFPITRQTPVTSTASGVDRQWISTVDAPGIMTSPVATAAAYELEAIFSYHIPVAGEIVAGVGTDGLVRFGVPVIPSVSQSGPSRIDVQPGSHGAGYFYQGYRDGTGFKVGVAPLSQFQSPTAYTVQRVTTDQPQVFPWINLDRQGNLYAVWVAPDGQLYYSFSRIDDPVNDPTHGGVPATKWSAKLKVNAPAVGSTIFPEVVAGDPGHIAIAFDGTTDSTGISDNVSNSAQWNTYVATSADALDSNPVFQSGVVSHQVIHVGTICTSGTTCPTSNPPNGGDRSLLDMIDITMDSDGRPAVVFTDNNNSFARQESSLGSQGSPFVKVARLATGPSLLTGHGPYAISYPTDYRSSAAGDATWPNTAAGKNLPALDILGSGVSSNGTTLTARIDLADASTAGFVRDLNAYNTQNSAAGSTDVPASRLQYVARWDLNGETYYLAADVNSSGTPTYYGGKVDATNQLSNGNAAVGITYRPQAGFTVTGTIQGNSLLITGQLAQFGATLASTLVSYAAHSFAGPADTVLAGQTTSSQIFTTVRNIDSSPAMDAALTTPAANVAEAPWAGLIVLGSAAAAVAAGVRRRRHSRGRDDAVGGAG